MSYKKVIAGSLGMVAALGVFAVIGVTPSFADDTGTTTVNVTIGDDCQIGATGSTGGAAALTVSGLSASTQSGENTGPTGESIGVTCNHATGWTLTEKMNTGEDQILNIGGGTTPTTGFGPWTAGATHAAFAANTWGMKYAQVAAQAGASVAASAQAYHAVPANASAGATVATATGATSNYQISQTFGARTDGSLGAGTYTGVVLYSLAGN